MDDYTLQQELEALAGNAFTPSTHEDAEHMPPEPMSTTIARWQTLFHLTPDTAVDRIMSHRNNLTRPRISSAHWDIVRSEKEAAGYDREAYEYELDVQKRKATTLPDFIVPEEEEAGNGEMTYLVEMSGLLDSREKIRRIIGVEEEEDLVVVKGRSVEDGREVELCCMDAAGKRAVLRWAGEEGGGFEPTILVDPRSLR